MTDTSCKGTLLASVTVVPKVCLATWEIINKATLNKMGYKERNLLIMSGFSIFGTILKNGFWKNIELVPLLNR